MESLTVTSWPLCPDDEGDCIFWKGDRRFRTDHQTAQDIFRAWAVDFSTLEFSQSKDLLEHGLQTGTIVEIKA